MRVFTIEQMLHQKVIVCNVQTDNLYNNLLGNAKGKMINFLGDIAVPKRKDNNYEGYIKIDAEQIVRRRDICSIINNRGIEKPFFLN